MGTTDIHGWLLPHDYYTAEPTAYGLSRLAPSIDSIRSAHPGRTALVDSGDLLQGNPLAFVYSELQPGEVHPVVHAMNLLEYDAAAIGNHEFNFGIEHLAKAMAAAKFPFLSANTFVHATVEHAYRPYTVIERRVDGRVLRIGIAGATPPGVHVWDRDHVEGRLQFRDIVESMRPVVAQMREEGADLVVVAAHSGLEGTSYDTLSTGLAPENVVSRLAREIPEIDVIFMGHTHGELADSTIDGTLVLQARNWARSLAVAEIHLAAAEGGEWRVISKRGQIVRPDTARDSERLQAELAPAHRRTMEFVNRPIGTSTARWSATDARVRDTPIIDFVNEVQRTVAGTDLSATSAFNLSAVIPQGPVTVADVARLYIYDNNTLKAVRITGEQLRAYLEKSAEYYLPCPGSRCERLTNPAVPGYNFDIISGVDYTLDLTKPVGRRVTRLERNGQPVRHSETFTLALNNYRQGGGGGFSMLADAPVVYDGDESIRDLLTREIERRGTISPEAYFRRNWEIVPQALAERASAEQNQPDAPR
ncbi:MAG: 5'-nucleotidase C-terminal domain-containing protein [Gemmatimonadetes bacterium]|nr:5'-nucleotidase C-terminal domain-containing protein [Gemmatimonadota bacterium]